MYDGPGGQETPKLGRMSMQPQPGMYGKGSKISYGGGAVTSMKMGGMNKHAGKSNQPGMHKMPSFIKGRKK